MRYTQSCQTQCNQCTHWHIIHTCTATVLRHYGLFCIVSLEQWQKHGHWQIGSWQSLFDKHLTVDTTPSFVTLIWQSPQWTVPLSARFTNGISLPSEEQSHLIASLDASLPGSTLSFLGLGSGSATGSLCMIHPCSWLGSSNCDSRDSSSWVVIMNQSKGIRLTNTWAKSSCRCNSLT